MDRVIFGNETLYRIVCPSCKNPLLSVDGEFKCDCGYIKNRKRVVRTIIETTRKRCLPPMWIKRKLMTEQGNCCYWCGREFKALYIKKSKVKSLRRNFDHKIPYSYEQRNRIENWCIACNICNKFKKNFLFNDEEDCQKYLGEQWDKAIKNRKIELI